MTEHTYKGKTYVLSQVAIEDVCRACVGEDDDCTPNHLCSNLPSCDPQEINGELIHFVWKDKE